MRIKALQLAAQLARGLAPVYLICGAEPLQLGEAAQAVRAAARAQGFDEREVLEVEASFDWGRLGAAAQTLSLFSARRLIELRVPSARLGKEGGEAVRAYCDRPAADTLLLILAPELEHKELTARWVQTVDQAGVVLPVRQLTGGELVGWVEQRLRGHGLVPGAEVAALLAERVEGNLLAAAQEVDKLALLYGEGPIDREGLLAAIGDSARFDVFALPDAVLGGDRARVHRVLTGLAAEGTAPAIVLWALAKEARMLASAAFAVPKGSAAVTAALEEHRVWSSRRGLIRAALRRLKLEQLRRLVCRCAEADLQIKGVANGDPWLTLGEIADELAGGRGERLGVRS
jgi:DNA polymerase-3 subunit delta